MSYFPGFSKLEVSNKEMFVILEVDSSSEVVVGMHSNRTQQAMSGELRLAVGGILIDKDRLMIQVKQLQKLKVILFFCLIRWCYQRGAFCMSEWRQSPFKIFMSFCPG